ncbi:hypothetical protein [Bacillus sp. FJAT-28004]|uniref:hypothetical protein n=1 Tax=Bacillus sp. FJAT-28004 TaxID=1679165 RepID=UPI0006B5D828|nr:hypothetical protein [Bacillus sp. FJAT-28004]
MRKPQLYIHIFTILMVILTGCGKGDNAQSTSIADLAVIYSTLEEITDDSELVVEVTMTGEFEQIPEYEGANFKLTDAEVNEVIKGDESYNGSNIKIFEFAASNIKKKNDKFVLFLHKYEGPVTSEEAFVISGLYQGKFRIDDKGKINYDAAKNNGEVTFQDELSNKNLVEFKTSIKEKMKKSSGYLN